MDSAYKWDYGWMPDEEAAFYAALTPEFKKLAEKWGVTFHEFNSKRTLRSGESPTIGCVYERCLKEDDAGNKLTDKEYPYVHLHPLCMTGFATPAQVEELAAVLRAHPEVINGISVEISDNPIYNLSEAEYLAMLQRNSGHILDAYHEYLKTYKGSWLNEPGREVRNFIERVYENQRPLSAVNSNKAGKRGLRSRRFRLHICRKAAGRK